MALRCITRSRPQGIFPRTFSTVADKPVSLDVDDKTGIATLKLQRPPVNSLNRGLLQSMLDSFAECENNKCRGLILTSSNNSVFSAGLDITEMYRPDNEKLTKFWTTFQDAWLKLYGSSYPTVAVVNGHSPAAGCCMALSCEYRIMVKDFTIGLNDAQLGLPVPFWMGERMIEVIGIRKAELALTTGRLFTTGEALNVGLIDEKVDNADEGMSRAREFLGKFSKISPAARAFTKSAVRREAIQSLVMKKQEDLDTFLEHINYETVQKPLGKYFEALKNKKKA